MHVTKIRFDVRVSIRVGIRVSVRVRVRVRGKLQGEGLRCNGLSCLGFTSANDGQLAGLQFDRAMKHDAVYS